MKNLLTFNEFLSENYLPYFGVKQSLDDSENFGEENKSKTSDFHRVYSMSPTWWNTWKMENSENFKITQDAFSKIYQVSKDDKVLFIYDYARYKIFTDESPQVFVIKDDITPEELEKAKNKDVADPNKKSTPEDSDEVAPEDDNTKTEEE